jgi:putative membrane protein
MRKLALLATVAAAFAAAPAVAQPQPSAGQPGTTGSRTAAPGGPATATATNQAQLQNLSGPEFMRMAAMSDRFEIGSSRLAEQRSQSAEVKQFAQEMVRDHTKTTDQLQHMMQGGSRTQTSGADHGSSRAGSGAAPAGSASGGTGMTTAQGGVQPTGLDAQHQQMLAQLEAAQGKQFDILFAQLQVQAHQQAVQMFQAYAQNGDDAQLKQWAQQTVPALQDHLRKAQALVTRVSS